MALPTAAARSPACGRRHSRRTICQEMRRAGQDVPSVRRRKREDAAQYVRHLAPPAYPSTPIPMKTHTILVVLGLAGVSLAAWGADAAANWKEHCAKCHGDDGKGNTKMGRKLDIRDISKADVQAKFTDAEAMKAMKEGLKDKDGKVSMKPAEGLSEDDMKALVGYVRGLKK
jgi:cytochrome c553